jgi:flavin reductase (DIM6/NTAB) family NADH-FMN oxidoreductase RutF
MARYINFMPSDLQTVSELFRRLNREVWLLTATDGQSCGGLIATFVCQASIVPDMPRVLVGIARSHHTWKLIDAGNAFALHLLGEANIDWVWRFGLRSGKEIDKFTGLALHTEKTGSPLLSGALAGLDCRVEARLETGDRTLFLAEVLTAELAPKEPVLTMERLLELASPEQKQDLKAQLDRDARIDAAAIKAWRTEARRS